MTKHININQRQSYAWRGELCAPKPWYLVGESTLFERTRAGRYAAKVKRDREQHNCGWQKWFEAVEQAHEQRRRRWWH